MKLMEGPNKSGGGWDDFLIIISKRGWDDYLLFLYSFSHVCRKSSLLKMKKVIKNLFKH